MLLNSAPLNTTTIGGASSLARYIRAVITQVVSVSASLSSAVTKYGKIACTVTASGAISSKRKVFDVVSGAVSVVGACAPRVIHKVYGAVTAFVSVVGDAAGYVQARFSALGELAVSTGLAGTVYRIVHGSASQVVGLNGSASGIGVHRGEVPEKRIAFISSGERTTSIRGA